MKRWYFLSPLILQKLIWVPTRIILKTFGHFEVIGFDKLQNIKTNAIFAVNHTSELDPILLPAAIPFFSHFSPIFYTSREQSFYKLAGWRQALYGGNFFKIWGAYPVLAGLQSYERSLANHIPIVNDGGNICIFPEGRRSLDGVIKPAKGGVAYLAHITGRPIIPVRYDGTFHISFLGFFAGRHKLKVTFGDPVYVPTAAEGMLSIDELKAVASSVMDRIRSMGQATI